MTKEEKEAIKTLKEHCLEHYYYDDETVFEAIEILLNLIQKQQEEIEYHKSQKTSDDQFKNELLETIRCKSLEIDSLNKILDDRLVCIQGGRGLYAKLRGLDKEYLIREYLSMYKMCKQELEKKDKIIDEMAEHIEHIDECMTCTNEDCHECAECIKQYFEKKVEDK